MKILLLTLIIFLLASCTKAPVNLGELPSLKITNRTITAVICNDAGYAMHPGAFVVSTDYQTSGNADTISDGLWYVHNYLSGDTAENRFHYPCAEASPGKGAVYVYPDHALQSSPEFAAFKDWFKKNMVKWMNGHECPDCINISPKMNANDTSFARVKCTM